MRSTAGRGGVWEGDGSIAGVIEGLNRILDIAIPGENQEGGTVVIPGHGRLSDETEVANYRDMLTIVRDRVAGAGMTLEQVQKAKPTSDYDGIYDEPNGWSAAMFVAAVYRDLNDRGRAAAAAWDLERDKAEGNLCKAFAGPGLMRQPTRIRIDWEDDDTLRFEFDAGRQIRRLEFAAQAPAGRALQGYSQAQWFRQTQSRGVFGQRTPPEGGSLVVRTTQLTGGYLRPNGVPFSERTTVKEFFNTFTLPGDAGAWLIVTMVVDDPEYLTTELVVSSQFKKESSRGEWNPRPCDIAPPLRAPAPTPADPFAAAASRP